VQIKISSEQVRDLLDIDPLQLPAYTSQLLNLANSNAQATRPKIVGQMSDLIQEFSGHTVAEWEKWYLKRHANDLLIARERIKGMVEKLKDAIAKIDDAMIDRWLRDLVIVKTYAGLRFQQAILARVATEVKLTFRSSKADEESQGIDGYIGDIPISIKPATYKLKAQLDESLPATVVFYHKEKNDLIVEFDESAFHTE
jgi:hypothetical protein